MRSHPMWVRGLKQIQIQRERREEIVAPHVGAWIETEREEEERFREMVAPHVGAWIETEKKIQIQRDSEGRTPCGCVD